MTIPKLEIETLRRFSLGLLDEAQSREIERLLDADVDGLSWDGSSEWDDELTSTLRGGQIVEYPSEVTHLIEALRELRPTSPSSSESSFAALLDPPVLDGELGRVGKYQVFKVVGHGGMGVVFKAFDTILKRTVALKFLLDSRLINPSHAARFEREATALAHLSHSGIVSIYEIGQHRGRTFLALEYLAGGTLAARLRVQPQPIRESARLVQILARAVHFAHSNGVVHRDLKPGNILFADADIHSAKIADFGLARRFDEIGLTETGALLGTPGYLAPELINQKSTTADPTGDVYALGAILYELLTGRPPYVGSTILETLEQARSGPPENPSRLRKGIPADLETIVLKCLQIAPSARYTTAEALADDIDRFLLGHPIKAKPTSILERLQLWAVRDPASTALIVVSLISIVILSIMQYRTQSALNLVRQKESEANHARLRADQNYTDARQTIEQMLDRIKESGSTDVPRFRELRRQLQNEALQFYKTVAEQDATTLNVQRDVVFATYEAATIHVALEEKDQAKQLFEKTIESIDQLSPKLPSDVGIRQLKINALSGLTNVSADNTNEILLEAIAIGEQLLKEYPQNVDTRGPLAIAWNNLGRLATSEKNYEKAVEYFTKSVEQRDLQFAAKTPNRKELISLATTCSNLQFNLAVLGKESNRDFAKRAASILEKLHRLDPQDVFVACRLSGQRVNFAYDQANNGDHELATRLLTESIDTLEPMLAKDPTSSEIVFFLFNAHGARAEITEAFENYATSITSWRRSLALSEKNREFDCRLGLMRVLVKSNQKDLANAEISDLLDEYRRKPTASRAFAASDILNRCGQTERAIELLTEAKGLASPEEWTNFQKSVQEEEHFAPVKAHPLWMELTESNRTNGTNP